MSLPSRPTSATEFQFSTTASRGGPALVGSATRMLPGDFTSAHFQSGVSLNRAGSLRGAVFTSGSLQFLADPFAAGSLLSAAACSAILAYCFRLLFGIPCSGFSKMFSPASSLSIFARATPSVFGLAARPQSPARCRRRPMMNVVGMPVKLQGRRRCSLSRRTAR